MLTPEVLGLLLGVTVVPRSSSKADLKTRFEGGLYVRCCGEDLSKPSGFIADNRGRFGGREEDWKWAIESSHLGVEWAYDVSVLRLWLVPFRHNISGE